MPTHVAADAASPLFEDMNDLASWTDPQTGIIRVLGRGQWTAAQVELHFTALGNLIARRRDAGERVLVLVDLSESLVQEQAIIERVGRATSRIYQESDRVAVVVASSLLKLQLKRVADVSNLGFFVSLNAARTWLTAYL